MTTEIKTTVENQIKNLIPVESFKKPYKADYDRIWIPALAEDVLEALPKGHAIELVEGDLIITKQEEQKEGFEKFLADSTRTIFDQDNTPTFSKLLEETINNSYHRKLLI